VYSTSSPTLPWVRTFGVTGSGSAVGSPLQVAAQKRYICALPFSPSSILIDDSGNGRIVEADVLTGNLVKVWSSGFAVGRSSNVAASFTMVAIGTSSQVDFYDTTGVYLRSITTGLTYAVGMRFSADSSYIVVADMYSASAGSLKKFRTSDGAAQTPLTTAADGLAPYDDVEECISTTTGAVGVVLLNDNVGKLRVVDSVPTVTAWSGSVNHALAFTLVPGFVALVAAAGDDAVVVLTSVAILTHPVSATVVVGSSATFTVALTSTSASAGLTYVWTKSGVVVGTNSSSYTYTSVDADGGQSFSIVCTVSHASGLAASNAAALTVQVRSLEVQVEPWQCPFQGEALFVCLTPPLSPPFAPSSSSTSMPFFVSAHPARTQMPQPDV
jgi:hypothetical protein